MNREIKLRTWCETDNGDEMIYLGSGEFDNGLWFNSDKHISVYHSVMQFTGLIDENNKEIYEGDILSCPFQDKMETSKGVKTKLFNLPVTFEDGSFSFKIGKSNIDQYRFHPNIDQCIIIGNIHQNPELL